ncbi:MAG TPA: M23 family metallopeptidase [Phenylobacterium sp.]|nr:M23 family metallopeptidase [Phenylobacterium sp.]
MSDETLAPAAPARRGLVDGLLGAALTLTAITVAHAALPDPAARAPRLTPAAPPPAQRIAAEAAAARRSAGVGPAVLIAFAEPLPDGEVGSPFGLRQLPWEAHARLHAGVDIVTPGPEPVLASADGVVVRVGQDPGYGRFVELAHAAGLTTLYGHLKSFGAGVAPGAAIKAGSPVGELGSTGTSTGAHLHFEVHDAAGRPLDPERFLGHAFTRAADLPLAQARRIPRTVRVAYVSRIPKAKQALMEARLDGDAAEAGGEATDFETGAGGSKLIVLRRSHGRVHTTLRF